MWLILSDEVRKKKVFYKKITVCRKPSRYCYFTSTTQASLSTAPQQALFSLLHRGKVKALDYLLH